MTTNKLVLQGSYYAECQKVFRACSDQNKRMLHALANASKKMEAPRILSVGAGSGLFELPMLRQFEAAGRAAEQFIGLDADPEACDLLKSALEREFDDALDFDVVVAAIESFDSKDSFDLVLYNHVFEYIRAGHADMLRQSRSLLRPGGKLAIFSPLRGGINQLYEANMQALFEYIPFFSDDIAQLLEAERLDYDMRTIEAECDIRLLEDVQAGTDGLRLLSFLIQVDGRELSVEEQAAAVSYFQGLADDSGHIPHPTDFYILDA